MIPDDLAEWRRLRDHLRRLQLVRDLCRDLEGW